jgi:hypothetical protein
LNIFVHKENRYDWESDAIELQSLSGREAIIAEISDRSKLIILRNEEIDAGNEKPRVY